MADRCAGRGRPSRPTRPGPAQLTTSRSPAERLIAVLFHPEVRHQLPITSPVDLVKTAFGIALDEDFSDEELEKLARWREEVRDRGGADAPPTGG